jgi:hypothetical protein
MLLSHQTQQVGIERYTSQLNGTHHSYANLLFNANVVQVLDDNASAALGGRKSTASRISRFASFPPVLVLVLKRYYVSGADHWVGGVHHCTKIYGQLQSKACAVLVLVLKRYYVSGAHQSWSAVHCHTWFDWQPHC